MGRRRGVDTLRDVFQIGFAHRFRGAHIWQSSGMRSGSRVRAEDDETSSKVYVFQMGSACACAEKLLPRTGHPTACSYRQILTRARAQCVPLSLCSSAPTLRRTGSADLPFPFGTRGAPDAIWIVNAARARQMRAALANETPHLPLERRGQTRGG